MPVTETKITKKEFRGDLLGTKEAIHYDPTTKMYSVDIPKLSPELKTLLETVELTRFESAKMPEIVAFLNSLPTDEKEEPEGAEGATGKPEGAEGKEEEAKPEEEGAAAEEDSRVQHEATYKTQLEKWLTVKGLYDQDEKWKAVQAKKKKGEALTPEEEALEPLSPEDKQRVDTERADLLIATRGKTFHDAQKELKKEGVTEDRKSELDEITKAFKTYTDILKKYKDKLSKEENLKLTKALTTLNPVAAQLDNSYTLETLPKAEQDKLKEIDGIEAAAAAVRAFQKTIGMSEEELQNFQRAVITLDMGEGVLQANNAEDEGEAEGEEKAEGEAKAEAPAKGGGKQTRSIKRHGIKKTRKLKK